MTSLLRLRRFGPFFFTQALGATNDNLLKGALLVLIAVSHESSAKVALLSNLAAGLFILPFLLFSGVAGELADRFDKARLIYLTKLAELGLMLLAAAGFLLGAPIEMLIALLFMMGAQSTFFSPMKYSILPTHLRSSELMSGNAWLGGATFIAILVGSLAGSALAAEGARGKSVLALGLVTLAAVGVVTARAIPPAPTSGALKGRPLQVFGVEMLKRSLKRYRLRVLLGAIAFFWFLGALYLTHMPLFVRDALGLGPRAISVFLALFALGIGAGSAGTHYLAKGRIDLSISVLGLTGLSILPPCLLLLPLAGAHGSMGRIALGSAMIFGIGMAGGLYIVPLLAAIQRRSRASQRGRVMAASNWLSSLAMVISAAYAIAMTALLSRAGLGTPDPSAAHPAGAGALSTVTYLFASTGILGFTLLLRELKRQPRLRHRTYRRLLHLNRKGSDKRRTPGDA